MIVIILSLSLSLLTIFLTTYNIYIYIHVLFMPLFLSFSMRKFRKQPGTLRTLPGTKQNAHVSIDVTGITTFPGSQCFGGHPVENEVITSSLWFSMKISDFLGMCARYMMCINYIRSPSLITIKSPQTTCHHMKVATWRWPHGHRVFRWTPVNSRVHPQVSAVTHATSSCEGWRPNRPVAMPASNTSPPQATWDTWGTLGDLGMLPVGSATPNWQNLWKLVLIAQNSSTGWSMKTGLRILWAMMCWYVL